jgi:hypothetical protein
MINSRNIGVRVGWPTEIRALLTVMPANDVDVACSALPATVAGSLAVPNWPRRCTPALLSGADRRYAAFRANSERRRKPDRIADAQLDTGGYGVLLECKTAKSVVVQPDAAEASKFDAAFDTDFAATIALTSATISNSSKICRRTRWPHLRADLSALLSLCSRS